MARDNTQLRSGREPPRQPPRFSGSAVGDFAAIQEWMKQVFDSLTDSGLGDPGYQLAAVAIDPEAPPDPTATTIGRAQATANLALTLVRSQAATITQLQQDLAALTARVEALETP